MAPATSRKRRNRPRRQRLDLSSSSSEEEDSSDDQAGTPEALANGTITQGETHAEGEHEEQSDSGDDSSSLGISSSDEENEDTASPAKRSRGGQSSASHKPQVQALEPEINGRVIKPLVLKNRPKSPSPPLFGFSTTLSANQAGEEKPFLFGHIKEDRVQSADLDPATRTKFEEEQKTLKAWYMDKVVNNFDKELDALKQEPGMSKRLDLFVKALSAGADQLSTTAEDLPDSLKVWAVKAWSGDSAVAGDREVILSAIEQKGKIDGAAAASSPESSSDTSSATGDVEMGMT